jgi:hypothetical protein
MAVSDDMNRLAAQDVVYLKRYMAGGVAEVFRGRLRQALNGEWVFNASTGQNGVVGFILGYSQQQSWTSSESPSGGIQVSLSLPVYSAPNLSPLVEYTVLTTVIPLEFTE